MNAHNLPATEQSAPNTNKNKVGKGVTGPRITKKHRQIIHHMITEGIDLYKAADKVELSFKAAQRLEDAPHFWQAFNEAFENRRKSGPAEAYQVISKIAATGNSEGNKLKAAIWQAGVDNVAPVSRVQGEMAHNVKFTGFAYPSLGPKDVTPKDCQSPDALPQPTDKSIKK